MAGSYLHVFAGETYSFTSSVTLDNAAASLAGATVVFLAKRDPWHEDDAAAIINASTAAGTISISGDNSNVVTISVAANVTLGMDEHPLLYWALSARTSENNVYTLDRGRMCIERPVVLAP